MSSEKKLKHTREFNGIVVGAGMTKTINVRVDEMKMHAIYKKPYRVSKKYHVHDEKSVAKVGDKVSFVECRPLSKTKRWRLVSVLSS
jgi:small subunit ribosomal protein S17